MCVFHNVDLQRCLSVRGRTVVLRAQRPLSLASTALAVSHGQRRIGQSAVREYPAPRSGDSVCALTGFFGTGCTARPGI